MKKLLVSALFIPFIAGCQTAQYHMGQVQSPEVKQTLATMQQIKVGMDAPEVLALMGSPNMVTTGKNGNEVWVYDKISTQAAVSGGANAWTNFGSGSTFGAASRTQKTMTAIIKFDENNIVIDRDYRHSQF